MKKLAAAESKAKKQQTLLSFLGNTSINRNIANKLDTERKTVEDIQIQLACMTTLEHIVFSIEQLDQSGKKNCSSLKHYTW